MDQPIGSLKTVVRVIRSDLIGNSNGSYEIFIDLEAQDGMTGVSGISVYHYANNITQAWKLLQPLRPGSIHYVEGTFRWDDEKLTLMGPVFVPYRGDMDVVSSIFSEYDAHENTRTLQPETVITVCGCIDEILIDKTEDGDAAVIQLAERDDYCLIILPDLFETYKGAILGGKYLEYCGIPQDCSVKFAKGDDCTSTIIVKTIEIPILPDEMENFYHEQ